jgi:predicted nucleic acid-binding protein
VNPHPRPSRDSIFVDTSAFFALADRTDRFHSLAVKFLEESQSLLVTSNPIIYETITLIRMRLGHEPAVRFGERLLDETITPQVHLAKSDEKEAWSIFRRYSDKRLSFVDCTSFALMKRYSIRTVFAFDDDFRQFGGLIVRPNVE